MKNSFFYSLFCVILFFLSCQNDEKIRIVKVDNRLINRVKVDSNLLKKLNSFYRPLNSTCIYFLNQLNGDVYKLNGENFKFTRILHSEIKEVETFSVDEKSKKIVLFSIDSLYVFHNNKLVKSNKIPEFKKGVLSYDDLSFKPILQGNNIFLIFYHRVFDAYKNKDFYDKSFECIYNYENGSLKILNVTYPKSFKENCVGHFYIPDRNQLNDNQHIYFYKRSDSITIYDKLNHTSKIVFCGSREYKTFKTIKFEKLKSHSSSFLEEIDYENPHYSFSQVFPNNRLIARFYVKSLKHYKASHKMKVVLYDLDMNYLGESNYGIQNIIMFENEKVVMSIKFNKQFIECYDFSFSQ